MLHCVDVSYVRTISAALSTHETGWKKGRKDKNCVLERKLREQKNQEGCNITMQCKICLPSTKLLSASRDSTSNLKKHLEVSWRIVSAKASYTRHNFQCLKRYDSPSPKSG